MTKCHEAMAQLVNGSVELSDANRPSESPRFYIPISKIRAILNRMAEDVFVCNCDHCRKLSGISAAGRRARYNAHELSGKYATIFALLIYLNYPGLILEFQSRLLSLDRFLEKDQLNFLFTLGDRLNSGQAKALRTRLLSNQYSFSIRPVDARAHVHTELDPKEVFPIDSEHIVGRGNVEVFAFKIHKDYVGQTLGGHENNEFARKIFRLDNVKDGLTEWDTLLNVLALKWKKKDCTNIVSSLASFLYGNQFFIVSPLAKRTLKDYIDSPDNDFPPAALWAQMEGLASGLAYLHGNECEGGTGLFNFVVHLDLKPANILIFGDTMKIADFGHSKLRTSESNSDASNSLGYLEYAPPERENPSADDRRRSGREDDLWSLGAIYSEVAILDVLGASAVREYRNCRKQEYEEPFTQGYANFHKSGRVKDTVIEKHEEVLLRVERSRKATTREYLSSWHDAFIDQALIDLIQKLLSERPKDRGSAADVKDSLASLRSSAMKFLSRDQCVKGTSDIWEDAERDFFPSGEGVKETIECYVRKNEMVKCVLHLCPTQQSNGQILTVYVWTRHSGGIGITFEKDMIIGMPGQRALRVARVNRSEVNRGKNEGNTIRGITPIYTESDEPFKIQLKYYNHTEEVYVFRNARDALSFQSALTGQYIITGPTPLSGCKISKKSKIPLSKSLKDIIATGKSVLQIWSTLDILGHGPNYGPLVPSIYVVIIGSSATYLIRVHNTFTIGNSGQNTLGTDQDIVAVLSCDSSQIDHKLTVYEIERTIPITLQKEPSRFQKADQAVIKFESKEDVAPFWDMLRKAQISWAKAKQEHWQEHN
ncbi:MAG: hypothetical protein M1840_007524 [Geoglossum simile]|nr:MAG: hypothetical protein M1840_007524 [Geoglossum simile]